MGANDDLFTALGMFKQSLNELQTRRVINDAQSQVDQIKATETNEQKQRAALAGVSNHLVAQMAGLGTPATTIQAVAGAMGPKHFSNAGDMYREGLLTGDAQLQESAKQSGDFDFRLADKLAIAEAKRNPMTALLQQQKFQEVQDTHTNKLLGDYGKAQNAAQATSRSAYGQWAGVEARGDRLQAVLGDPDKWKNMTEQELRLVSEGTVQMAKGGVGTKEETEAMVPWMAKIAAARKLAAATGKPVQLDLSGFAGMFNNVIQREGDAAKDKMLDIVLNNAHAHNKTALRPGAENQFKLTTASALQQAGITVDPSSITVDQKNGVSIPGVTDVIAAANKAPTMVKSLYADAMGKDPVKQAAAQDVMSKYGISPSTPPKQAIDIIRKAIRRRVFQ